MTYFWEIGHICSEKDRLKLKTSNIPCKNMKKVKIIFWIPITKLKYYIQVDTNIVTVTVVILGQIVWECFCKLFPERGRMDWILLYNGGMCFRLSNWKVWQRLWSQGHKAFKQNKSAHELRVLLVQKCVFWQIFGSFHEAHETLPSGYVCNGRRVFCLVHSDVCQHYSTLHR